MQSKPPLRERSWYAAVWWVLVLISGTWTLFNAYLAYQIVLNPGHTEEQGLAVIGWEAFLVVSIPIYSYPLKTNTASSSIVEKVTIGHGGIDLALAYMPNSEPMLKSQQELPVSCS